MTGQGTTRTRSLSPDRPATADQATAVPTIAPAIDPATGPVIDPTTGPAIDLATGPATGSAGSATGLNVAEMPWLEELQGRTVVVKFGGNAMVDPALHRTFAQDVVELWHAGLRPVVVHGGGPQISAMLDRLDLETRFESGLRVTTPETMEVVRMVLTGQVQRELVGALNAHGPFAVGMSGEDAHTMTAVRRPAWVDGRPVDIGLVGEVVAVDPGTVRMLLDQGRIPVVSPVARGAGGEVYNVNADLAASALAVALGAERLVVLTDVEGLYADWPHSTEVIGRLTAGELDALLPGLASGMLPKMEGCLRAVREGVGKAHVLDGRVPHALLRGVFAEEGPGTTVVPDEEPETEEDRA